MNDTANAEAARRVSAAGDRLALAHRRATDLYRALHLLAHGQPRPRRGIVAFPEGATPLAAAGRELDTIQAASAEWFTSADEADYAAAVEVTERLASDADEALDRLAAIVAEHAPALAAIKPGADQ